MISLFLGLRGAQLIIVVLVILLLFGANKIPTLMRNLGKGVHSFKQGIEDAKSEINKEVKKADSDADVDSDSDSDVDSDSDADVDSDSDADIDSGKGK